MAPEYAMEGLFSVKSDVYSFGVLLLEILSGRRNTSFRHSDDSSLIGYVSTLLNFFFLYQCNLHKYVMQILSFAEISNLFRKTSLINVCLVATFLIQS